MTLKQFSIIAQLFQANSSNLLVLLKEPDNQKFQLRIGTASVSRFKRKQCTRLL